MKKLTTCLIALVGVCCAGIFIKRIIDESKDEDCIERGIRGAGDTLVGDCDSGDII